MSQLNIPTVPPTVISVSAPPSAIATPSTIPSLTKPNNPLIAGATTNAPGGALVLEHVVPKQVMSEETAAMQEIIQNVQHQDNYQNATYLLGLRFMAWGIDNPSASTFSQNVKICETSILIPLDNNLSMIGNQVTTSLQGVCMFHLIKRNSDRLALFTERFFDYRTKLTDIFLQTRDPDDFNSWIDIDQVPLEETRLYTTAQRIKSFAKKAVVSPLSLLGGVIGTAAGPSGMIAGSELASNTFLGDEYVRASNKNLIKKPATIQQGAMVVPAQAQTTIVDVEFEMLFNFIRFPHAIPDKQFMIDVRGLFSNVNVDRRTWLPGQTALAHADIPLVIITDLNIILIDNDHTSQVQQFRSHCTDADNCLYFQPPKEYMAKGR